MKMKSFDELSINELYNILRLRNEVFVVEQDCPYQDLDNKDQDSIHIYTDTDGVITSYVRVLPKGLSYPNAPSIGRVVVKETYRGGGLATTVMNQAIDYIYTNYEENSILISAQKYLVAFYSSLGFTTEGQEYLEDNIPHIQMIHTK